MITILMIETHDGIIDIITYFDNGAMKKIDISALKLNEDTDFEKLVQICEKAKYF